MISKRGLVPSSSPGTERSTTCTASKNSSTSSSSRTFGPRNLKKSSRSAKSVETSPRADFDEFLVRVREHRGLADPNDHIVLDAHAPKPGDVNPRFAGEHHPLLELKVAQQTEPLPVVDGKAKRVA